MKFFSECLEAMFRKICPPSQPAVIAVPNEIEMPENVASVSDEEDPKNLQKNESEGPKSAVPQSDIYLDLPDLIYFHDEVYGHDAELEQIENEKDYDSNSNEDN
jgi:hypothetical protein